MVQHLKNRRHANGSGEKDQQRPLFKKKDETPFSPGKFLGVGLLGAAVVALVVMNVMKMMPIWLVNWPTSLPKLVTSEMIGDPELLWGTYRPNVYFGVKARVPRSPVFGLAWMNQYSTNFPPQLRHWCYQDDKLRRYGWQMHDGRSFGHQELIDHEVALNTTFVKFCHSPEGFCDWSARIAAKPINTQPHASPLFSLFFYVAFDPANYDAQHLPEPDPTDPSSLNHILANNVAGLGSFKLSFQSTPVAAKSYAIGGVNSFDLITDYLLSTLSPKPLNVRGHQRHFVAETLAPRDGARPNLIIYQLTFDEAVVLDVAFFNKTARTPVDAADNKNHIGAPLTSTIAKRSDEFVKRFEGAFNIGDAKHQFSKIHEKSAMAAFSNLIGGIGYFYGWSLVAHPESREAVPYGPAGLYTGVPSRSFFPRGFLWDEGFHTYLLSFWDVDIVIQILSHWLDMLNRDGWIPREQILDVEARKRVPAEFIVQKSNDANPPAMFFTLRRLAASADPNTHQGQRVLTFLTHAFPRLRLWVDWYLDSQTGMKPLTYRWRGRDADETHQLNPKTLTSGLDDYPRASHPTLNETHVDLRCWIAFVTRSMAEIGKLVNLDASKYAKLADKLYDNSLLNKAHWFDKLERYADVGLHSPSVRLARQNIQKRLPDGRITTTQEVRRVVKVPPVFGPVGDSEGYVSLFPLLTKVVDPNSPQLGILLRNLNDSSRMWTSFGLRSLSSSSSYYRKRNTEHDPPYWRGQIWMNINYLVLSSLHHYTSLGDQCQYSALASELYGKLRKNLIGNVIKQYERSGYFWEQYDDTDGHGMGSHPFTGWTSLVVLMMAENF